MEDKTVAFVLGSDGMLGTMVTDYLLAKNWEVIEYNRGTQEPLVEFIKNIGNSSNNYLFNCIGSIPQKHPSVHELYSANLKVVLEIIQQVGSKVHVIQPSTDCVFSGDKSTAYDKYDFDIAKDDYGMSKRAAELFMLQRPNSYIIRTSIIGLGKNDKGLLSWILSQKNKTVDGFSNHYWNGITTLEWCKQTIDILSEEQNSKTRIHQLGTQQRISKEDLIRLVSKIFDLNITVNAVIKSPKSLILKSDRYIIPLHEQLKEMKKWKNLTSKL